MELSITEVIIRFAVTFALALVFGIDRQRSNKPIGFGTFIFVSVGACALAIIAVMLNGEAPLSMLAAIVTGVGFLGAGALIKTPDKTFGFTTAASIWVFAIVGATMGIGNYLIAFIVYVSIWIVAIIDKYMEGKGLGLYRKKMVVHTNKIISISEIKDLMNIKKCKMTGVDIDKKNNKLAISYLIEGSKNEINDIPKKLLNKDWLDSCKVE